MAGTDTRGGFDFTSLIPIVGSIFGSLFGKDKQEVVQAPPDPRATEALDVWKQVWDSYLSQWGDKIPGPVTTRITGVSQDGRPLDVTKTGLPGDFKQVMSVAAALLGNPASPASFMANQGNTLTDIMKGLATTKVPGTTTTPDYPTMPPDNWATPWGGNAPPAAPAPLNLTGRF